MIQDVDNMAVFEIFSSNRPARYLIPKYQREYVWRKRDWEALVDDLLEREEDESHFLGTFLCVNLEKASHKAPRFEVIDGQQRLTTISLLLAAVFNVLATETERDEEEVAEFVALRKMLVFDGEPRLSPQESGENNADFQAVLMMAGLDITARPPRYMGNRRIEQAYRFFLRRIAEEADSKQVPATQAARDLYLRMKNAVMVKLEVSSFSDAFKLFESLNNRGKPLSPIDLVKNKLLAEAGRPGGVGIDAAYNHWLDWLAALGDDERIHERFFRHLYNAMRDVWQLALPGVPVATKSNLIRIYEELVERDVDGIIAKLDRASAQYGRLIKNVPDDLSVSALDRAFADLVRAEGTSAHILLLYLLLTQNLDEADLLEITRLLIAFSVRRNLTNTPPTNAVARLFMEVISDIENSDLLPRDVIANKLKTRSATDEQMLEALRGRIYDDRPNVARFVLVEIAKKGMTKESWQDLWARDRNRSGDVSYRWTIEHILPQTDAVGDEWIEMLGGIEDARQAQEKHLHELGNLTITGYNSALGKLSFVKKRDRQSDGRDIGYRNGLSLNADLAERDDWNQSAIVERTARLSAQVLEAFPLA